LSVSISLFDGLHERPDKLFILLHDRYDRKAIGPDHGRKIAPIKEISALHQRARFYCGTNRNGSVTNGRLFRTAQLNTVAGQEESEFANQYCAVYGAARSAL
jgi:phage host-nuclease inhibitor protein Gam